MGALHAVLKARHGKRPAGHWVVMRATIAGVNLMAVAYAWSQKGVSYFISTCGSTDPHEIKYESKFEDEWGNTNYKLIDRPCFAHFLYQYLPLIDEHNKQRQSLLQLEKRWLTKCPWTRLVSSILGMCVVDMHRIFRYDAIKNKGVPWHEIDMLRVVKFTDLLCGSMRLWPSYMDSKPSSGSAVLLERMRDKQGHKNKPPTDRQLSRGLTVGNPVIATCFICRKYTNAKGTDVCRRSTSFWCIKCHMPLCKIDRTDDRGRLDTCIYEHNHTHDAEFACQDLRPVGLQVDPAKVVDHYTRRARRSNSSKGQQSCTV